jgi:murein DD-endopeptidase MepM/ murein hydrolase activator NlpD
MAHSGGEDDHQNPRNLSLDPLTWFRPGGPPAASASPSPNTIAEPPKTAEPAIPEDGGPGPQVATRRLWLAAAGGGGLVALAGGAWLLSRPGKGPNPMHPSASAVTGESRRVLMSPSVAAVGRTLASSGLPAAEAAAIQASLARTITASDGELRLDMVVQIAASGSTSLVSLRATKMNGAGAHIDRANEGFKTTPISADAKRVVRVRRGEMDNESFYTSAISAGVVDSMVSEFAQTFAFDFDFQREVKAGDQFEAVYDEDENGSGQAFGQPFLLYAALRTSAKQRAFYRFTPPGTTEPSWFDSEGKGITKNLMRTPVDGARISSTFGWRVHPIQGFMKLHKGVDFAVPIGTPIYAAGDATVTWAAMKGPNGNLVILKHDNGWETYYLHLSAFGSGVTAQARVRQGQAIGLSGMTGAATGPHLHYEVHINGQAVDPMTVATGGGTALSGPALTAFALERERIDKARSSAL